MNEQKQNNKSGQQKTISFCPEMIDLILLRKKTITIRPMKPQPLPGSVTLPKCPYGVGDVVAVREQPEVLLRIIGVVTTWWHALKVEYVAREGLCAAMDGRCAIVGGNIQCDRCPMRFTIPSLFFELWESIYGETEYKAGNRPAVWVYEFNQLEEKKQ